MILSLDVVPLIATLPQQEALSTFISSLIEQIPRVFSNAEKTYRWDRKCLAHIVAWPRPLTHKYMDANVGLPLHTIDAPTLVPRVAYRTG